MLTPLHLSPVPPAGFPNPSQSSVGPGGIGGVGGASGGWGNIAFRKVLHLDWKSTACCPWKLRIGVLSIHLGLVYL